VELSRYLDTDLDEEIPLPVTVQYRHTLILDAEGGSGLSSVGDFQRMLAFQSRHANLGPQGCLCHRDGNHAMQVVPFPLEEGMFFYRKDDVEIPGGPAEVPCFTETRISNARTVFNPSRNFYLDGPLAQNAPLTLALEARVGNNGPRTLTG